MKILKSSSPPSITYFKCRIETGECSRYSIGDRILFDDGDVISGPLQIVGKKPHGLIVTADEDYLIYERVDASEVELDDLEPITNYDYDPVTNNIFLDGFLGAAYQDDTGIVRVDVSLPGLKQYYTNQMEENNIDYRITEDGFIFPESCIIQEIINRQKDLMPPKYVIGFLSSHIVEAKIKVNSNPRYERYGFVLTFENEYYDEMAPEGLYYSLFHSQHVLFSIFGSYEPLAYHIDLIEPTDNEPIFNDQIHMDDIYREIAPKILIKSFSFIGYCPELVKIDEDVTYCNVTIKEKNGTCSASVAITSNEKNVKDAVDYIIVINSREPILFDYTKNQNNPVEENLFYHPAFKYSNELRGYLQIIFNKM